MNAVFRISAIFSSFIFVSMSAVISFAQTQPNIIVVLVDDAGYADWGFNGSDQVQTPNIDNLVNRGTYFSEGYVSNSVCSPSRAGLITGRYQNRFGYEFNLVTPVIAPGYSEADLGLDVNEKTFGDYLKPLGYSTSIIGKWHLGEKNKFHPNNRGFDYFYGLLQGARDYYPANLEPGKTLMRNMEFDDLEEGYLTDVLTDDAINWMDGQINADQPFFTFLSYTAVHSPYQSKPEDLALFDDCNCTAFRQNLLAMTYNLDENMGKIVDFLEAKGEFDNTLIIFTNDNGGSGSQGGTVHYNAPFRGRKSTAYEGGLRVPFFMTWPNGSVPANNVYDEQIITLDILPTVLAAAGGQLPGDRTIDGVDLVPHLNNSSTIPHEYLFWRKAWEWSVVKKGNKKMIIQYNDQPDETDNDTAIYDLDVNLYEGTNLLATEQATKADFLQKYAAWEQEMVLPYWFSENLYEGWCGTGVPNSEDCDFIREIYNGFGPSSSIYEAENASLAGSNIKIDNCGNASNGQTVNGISGGSNSVKFNVNVPTAGDYQLTISYISLSSPFRTANVLINGVQTDYELPPSGDWCFNGGVPADFTTTVTLSGGNNEIKFLRIGILDKIKINQTSESIFEAEDAQLSGSAIPTDCVSASNGQAVKKVKGDGVVTFDVTVPHTGNYNLTLSYISNAAKTSRLMINGVTKSYNIPATGLFCYQGGSPGDHTVSVNLVSGVNEIKVTEIGYLDKIEISQTSESIFEAEDAQLSGSAIPTDCVSASNGQAVKKVKGSAAVTFDITVPDAGSYDLTMSYISNAAKTSNLVINGVTRSYNIPATGLFCYQGGSPGDHTVSVDLVAGVNEIKVMGIGYLDKIELSLTGDQALSTSGIENSIPAFDLDKSEYPGHQKEVQIYPNVISLGQNINVNMVGYRGLSLSPDQNITVFILDPQGRVVDKFTEVYSSDFEINTQGIKKLGVYFVRIAIDDAFMIKKLIVTQ